MSQKNAIINKLRSSNLRPTRQRVLIAAYLFNREKTFHFTVEKLNKILNKKENLEKISLATIYNTISAFKKAGHLKEILTSNNNITGNSKQRPNAKINFITKDKYSDIRGSSSIGREPSTPLT